MAGTVELDIAGLEGNMMAQPRIFAHDAQPLNVADFGDLLATNIRQSLFHLGSITGEITTDDLLDNIFRNFCIGK